MVLTKGMFETHPVQEQDKMHVRMLERHALPRDTIKADIQPAAREKPVKAETVFLQSLLKY